MIPFRCSNRDRTRTPVVHNEEIWDYAEALVRDYKPSLLTEPTPINVIHFLESYLGATVEYQDIYYGENEVPIAGATVFNDDCIRVFDRESQCTRIIEVSAGTIIIDNSTVEKGNKGFESFTGLHEGGHFAMHGEVYRRDANQSGLPESNSNGMHVVCCRKDLMFQSYGRKLTPEQNREHQANTFAAFIAMPRATFIPFAESLIREAGFSKGIFVYDDSEWESDYALEKICKAISVAFGVSFTAAKIHLKELGLLMKANRYNTPQALQAV